MSLSMYSSSIPCFIRALNNLSAILTKGAAHAEANEIDPSILVTYRLFPDMFPLSRQVQIACDIAKGAGARIAGVDAPSHEDTESSFEELQERINKTVEFLKSIPEDSINGSEEKEIKFKAGPYEIDFVGASYLSIWALPNLYFHVTTTYNILRHNGVELGKIDYVGAP
ncbi:MAG: hypothetical protein DHS20C12_16680 [Pseudohongiella sp.]|nr:MAG: hypothetical protein DHS20C12_16680 [Pseudohongiella sp.]